ncbi:MAG: ATP-dependent Clp protease ATP-binding subunit [Candidatus Taylorbacteria bacterium]|nr:ATP-dependent Clp protease ATP-binding subunit [Candidatus Taylorbacteria bacterium]
MRTEDLDIPSGKIGESAQRVIDRAFEEARRRGHPYLADEHIFLAFIQIEWDMFAEVMRDIELNPHTILQALEEHLRRIPPLLGSEPRVSSETKLTFKLVLHHVSRAGRQTIEAADLFFAVFENNQGVPVFILRRHGVELEVLISRLNTRMRDMELWDERFKKRFELPPFLKHFATNLNLLACKKRLAQVFGRDEEIRRVMEVLCHRKRANSVMLIGEAGVGKTAVVEGLAIKIEFSPEEVPLRLRESQIVSLSMSTMVAGTMLRGMFEDRIQNVIREIRERPNLILFIDEAHTMIGAGSALGAPSDAANAFKSVMARGEIRIIAATTASEYKENIAEDEALARRFRTVFIEEPTLDQTREILQKSKFQMGCDYSVKIDDSVIETVLEMAPRYERHLHLPDKVIGWLDTACVRTEMDGTLEVSTEKVIGVIADNSKLPHAMVSRKVNLKFEDIENKLSQRVIGQSEAIRAVANRLILNKGPLKDGFSRPDGVLLFLGPTGVGKTELAKALAEFLFGDEKKMIRIDMSEYQAEYGGSSAADKLIGMPRGIVGSERGGILTNQIRDNPYSVILLDEIEKAGLSARNLFLQAFDEGWITDGRGKRAYLSDSIVIMTSNLGSQHFKKLANPMGFACQKDPDTSQVKKEVMKEMGTTFSPEFINRIDEVVVFSPLAEEEVRQIANKYINSIKQTLVKEGKTLRVDRDAVDKLVKDGHSLAYGARLLKRVIDFKIKIPISIKLDQASNFHVLLRDDKVEVEANGMGNLLIDPRLEIT